MNALIVTTIGGFVPQFEMNDVRILQEYGFNVHYASDFANPVYQMDRSGLEKQGLILHHIEIRKSPFRIWENFRACRQLVKLIRAEQIDLVHCHNPMGGVVGRLAAHFSKKRPYVIYTAHGFHFYKGAPLKNWLLYYTAEKFLARFTDRLITINAEDYARAKKFDLKNGGKVEKIHGVGVDMKRFRRREGPEGEWVSEQIRKSLGVPQQAFHIVTAAELNDNKNQRVVIEAIAALQDEDIYYSICGRGEKEAELRRLIVEKHLEERVRLLGYRNDMEKVLQSADCFAFPSLREGLGVAAVEALAASVPLIAAWNRGTREYLRDGENGIGCNATDVAAFREAIKSLKEKPELLTQMRRGCRESVRKFSLSETDRRMRRIYGEMTDILKKRDEGENV